MRAGHTAASAAGLGLAAVGPPEGEPMDPITVPTTAGVPSSPTGSVQGPALGPPTPPPPPTKRPRGRPPKVREP